MDRASAGGRGNGLVVSLPLRQVPEIGDLIDELGLGRRGSRRHREVGVTTAFPQQTDFLVDPAAFALRMDIVEGPVAVDVGVTRPTLGILAEQSVAAEILLSLFERLEEVLGGVAVVMEVDLHFASGGVAEVGEGGDQVAIVLFNGIKKGVLGRLAVGIAEGGDGAGELFRPDLQPFQGTGFVGVMEGFEMIADRHKDLQAPRGCGTAAEKVGKQPFVEGAHGIGEARGGIHQLPEAGRRRSWR